MKIEHVAIQVAEPAAMARWYVRHLGLTVVRSSTEPPYAHFLADDGGTVMLEIYHNTRAPLPNHAGMDPLELHLAFVSEDVPADRARLIDAGATPAEDMVTTPAGDTLAMLRDPWGLAVQLCQRRQRMI